MNILEQTEALKDLPDQALIQQMQMPTGEIAPIFITSELRRRKRMRDDYARREAADTPTVAEEVVMAAGMPQGGIADAARALAPKTSMGQNTGMGDMMPRTATQAPQRMASGGIVGMRQGGKLVKVMGANFYAFSDGEVYVENPDGSREAVTDPRVLGVIRQQANVGPERQEGTASLGSEIMADVGPQAPGLESVLSSDRPFSSLPPAVTDTRPAAPSDYGLGGERPSTLTDATQPAFNQEQALIDAMSPAFDRFGGDPMARAEERSNLSAPSISDVSPTVDLDLTTDQRISQEDMAMAVPVPQGQPRNFTQLLSDIENPVERGKAILAQSQSDQAQPYEGGEYTNAERDFDPFAPLGQERAARAVLAQQAPDNAKAEEELTKFLKSQEMAGGRPGGTTIEDTRMMNMLNAQRQAEEAANLEALRKTQPNVDVGTDPRFGDTMGLQEVLAGDFDPVSAALSAPAVDKESNIQKAVSELGLKPITRDGEEYFISPAGMVFKPEEGNLVPVAGGEAMQAMDVAQRQGEDFSASPAGQFGTYAVDPETGVVDPSKFTPFSGGDISGAKTPQFITDALGPGSTVSDFLNVQEGAAPVTKVDETKTRVAPVAGDTTTPASPDAGGITTVSTKAINDAAKSTGLGADAWLAIAQGGAAMAASKNPTLLGAFGEGMGVAAAGLQKQRAAEKTADLAQAKIDATLQAAQIRAAAAGKGSKLAATGSTLYPAIVGQLEQKELELATETSKGKGSSAAKIDSLTKEIESLKQRKRQIETASGLLVAAGGGGDTKNYDVS